MTKDDVDLIDVRGWAVDGGITWRTKLRGRPSFTLGYAIDLSSTGAAIRCGKTLRVGELLSMTMQLAQRELELTAKVVRFDEARNMWGVRFVDVPGAVLQAVLKRARETERLELSKFRDEDEWLS